MGLFLFFERLSLSRKSRRIPLRIAITGTRGKSTVTRLIASSLRESHFTVLAKTTGSRPVLIFPDGREEEILRKGRPSILEGKKIMRMGAGLGVQALVAEMMSIQPECLSTESGRILRPHILVITNVRLDHREKMGRTKAETARSLASAIPPQATVFIPDEEISPEFQEAARRLKAKIVRVRKGELEGVNFESDAGLAHFEENLRLALAVSRSLGVHDETALRGIGRAEPDFGSLKVWRTEFGRPPHPWFLVSAFAANEPESTSVIVSRIKGRLTLSGSPLIGLLNFRQDRGDRTLQWLQALEEGRFADFRRIYAVGAHVRTWRIRRTMKTRTCLVPLALESPAAIMETISSREAGGAVLVGMGNVGGLGDKLIRYWGQKGIRHAL